MVFVTALSGTVVVINAELIEHAEAMPDTVITLTTGNKFVVRETLQELTAKVLDFRRALISGKFMEADRSLQEDGPAHA